MGCDNSDSGISHLDVSKWVRKKIGNFYKFFGLSHEGFEDETLKLFSAIEQKWKGSRCSTPLCRKPQSTSRGSRELKKLHWTIKESGGSVLGIELRRKTTKAELKFSSDSQSHESNYA